MPKRPVKKPRYRRKSVKATRKRSNLPIGGFTKTKKVKLRYTDMVTINGGSSGNPAAYYYSANGVYDPDVTSTGHQPRYLDEWLAIYDHYTVVGSKIKVTAVPSGTMNVTPGMWGIFLDDNTTLSYHNAQDIIEGDKRKDNYRFFGPLEVHTNGKSPKLTCTFSSKSVFGKNPVGCEELRGSASANPAEQSYFAIWAAGVAGGDPALYAFLVDIEYIMVLTERKNFITSS